MRVEGKWKRKSFVTVGKTHENQESTRKKRSQNEFEEDIDRELDNKRVSEDNRKILF